MPNDRAKTLAPLLAACTGLWLAGCVTTGPVERTFDGADVRIPKDIIEAHNLDFTAAFAAARAAAPGGRRPQLGKARLDVLAAKLPPGAKLPGVVYFHGCAGMVIPSQQHLDWLEGLEGFVTIAPDSFARQRPVHCFSDYTVDISLSAEVGAMRQSEINHALRQVRAMPWVDRNNIFLMGHSQGASTVAGYRGEVRVRGRVLINGGCHDVMGGDGLRAGEAVLSFTSGRDPWFKVYTTHCRNFVLKHGGTSVYDANSRSHNLILEHWPVVRKFFAENRR